MTQSLNIRAENSINLSQRFLSSVSLSPVIVWIFAVITLLSYVLHAISNTGAALTLNSFDLAEWTSLHPAAGANNLQVSLFLRLQPIFIGMILALNIPVKRHSMLFWSGLLLLVLIALAIFPPLEFLAESENSNYQQQFLLSLITIGAGIMIFTGFLYRFRTAITVILLVAALLTYGSAISDAIAYMQPYGLMPGVGTGAMLLVVSYSVLLIYILSWQVKANRTAR